VAALQREIEALSGALRRAIRTRLLPLTTQTLARRTGAASCLSPPAPPPDDGQWL
jgi:hypothetical protein